MPMDHTTIEEQNFAERYVTGKLSPAEEERFEEHYLDCPPCIERVEAAQRLHRGLRRLAAQETSKAARLGLLGAVLAWSRSRQAALMLTVALVALLPAAYGWYELGHARGDLEAVRGERDRLAGELAQSRRPQVNTPIFSLRPVRGAGVEGPVPEIALGPEPEWIVLSLEPAGAGDLPSYRATLTGAGDRVVWSASDLEPGALGTLVVSLPSSFLTPGEYQLRLDGLPAQDEPIPAGRFALRVTRR